MKRDIILAGVGGQGILSIAYVIDNAALDEGLHFKQAEVHGMAQRGGAVQSHLRFSDGVIHSDLVPVGGADIILAVEPLEVQRYVHYLGPEGVAVASLAPFVNIADYPAVEEVRRQLLDLPRPVLVDSAAIAKEAATPRAQNMVMLGAAQPYLDLSERSLERYVTRLFERKGERVVTQNLAAFRAGAAAGRFFVACLDAGMAREDALLLALRISAENIQPESAAAWAAALAGPRGAELRTALAPAEDDARRIRADEAGAARAAAEGSAGLW